MTGRSCTFGTRITANLVVSYDLTHFLFRFNLHETDRTGVIVHDKSYKRPRPVSITKST